MLKDFIALLYVAEQLLNKVGIGAKALCIKSFSEKHTADSSKQIKLETLESVYNFF